MNVYAMVITIPKKQSHVFFIGLSQDKTKVGSSPKIWLNSRPSRDFPLSLHEAY